MGKTSIEWTSSVDPVTGKITPGKTWNPIRGCSRVSKGCEHCYAEGIAARFSDTGGAFHLFADRTRSGSKWTGKVELLEEKLREPLSWRDPCKVFVNSMSDLFHEALPDTAIDRVFAVMARCRHHTFQCLTKRPSRMLEYSRVIAGLRPRARALRFMNSNYEKHPAMGLVMGSLREDDCGPIDWPLPNVWLGVSVEDQKTADERIPFLLKTPAAVRFVSYEPALGPVDFRSLPSESGIGRFLDALSNAGCEYSDVPGKLDQIIVGGESGPGSRPFDIAWARKVIKQCKEAGVACFVKQLGKQPRDNCETRVPLESAKGGDPSEWPEDLRVREFPRSAERIIG